MRRKCLPGRGVEAWGKLGEPARRGEQVCGLPFPLTSGAGGEHERKGQRARSQPASNTGGVNV